jgi:hypothetical protein
MKALESLKGWVDKRTVGIELVEYEVGELFCVM